MLGAVLLLVGHSALDRPLKLEVGLKVDDSTIRAGLRRLEGEGLVAIYHPCKGSSLDSRYELAYHVFQAANRMKTEASYFNTEPGPEPRKLQAIAQNLVPLADYLSNLAPDLRKMGGKPKTVMAELEKVRLQVQTIYSSPKRSLMRKR